MHTQRECDRELCPLPWHAGDGYIAAAIFAALSHIFHAVALPRAIIDFAVKSAAVILDNDFHRAAIFRNMHADFGGGGVFEDIVQGFFDGEEEVVANFGRQPNAGNFGRHLKTTSDACAFEKPADVEIDVGDEAIERVVFRIHGPDNLVQRLDGVAGAGDDFFDVSVEFGRVVEVIVCAFAEHHD